MVFSSIVFLFAFLPPVLAVYYLAPVKLRNLVLLVASLIFMPGASRSISGSWATVSCGIT